MGLIHLIRHAAPTLQGVFLGSSDPPLASENLSPSSLDAASIFSSPLRRARRTAELLFPQGGLVVLPELAECRFGEWEGKTWDQIEARWPELAGVRLRNWRRSTPPGGESWDEFTARVKQAWEHIRLAPMPIVVVAHGGTNSVLAHLIAGRDPFGFTQQYCEVITLEYPS
jgi:probable phosphoglycerate mutase